MAVEKEQLGDLNLLVKVEVPPSEYQPEVNKSIKDYAKKVQLKGFRAGKVPPGVVKKMYGQSILAEELNKLVNNHLTSYIRDEELNVLGEPLPKMEEDDQQLDINAETTYTFSFEVGLQPDVDLSLLDKEPSLTQYPIKIDDELIDKEVEHMQKRFGKMTNPETVVDEEEDVLYVSLEELDKDGEVKEEGWSNDPAIAFDQFKGKNLRKQLASAKKGDTFTINLFKSIDKSKEEIRDDILNLKDNDLEVGDTFQLTVKNVNHTEKMEVGQELFDKVYGEGNIESEEAFREKIKEELGQMLESYTTQRLNNDIQKYLLDKVEANFPEDFLKRWLQYSNDGNVTEEDLEKEFEPFLRNLKWTLIVNKVMEANDIHVHREDIEARTRDMIKAEYGFSDDDPTGKEYLDQLVGHFMQNKEHVERLYDQMRDIKVFEVLREKFTLKDKPTTFDTFKEEMNA